MCLERPSDESEAFPHSGQAITSVGSFQSRLGRSAVGQRVENRECGGAVGEVEPHDDRLVRGVFRGVDERLLDSTGKGQCGVGRQGTWSSGHFDGNPSEVLMLMLGAQVIQSVRQWWSVGTER